MAKLKGAVLLDIHTTHSPEPGGVCKQVFTFAPIEAAEKRCVRFDVYDASTQELTEGEEVEIGFTPPGTPSNAPSEKDYGGVDRSKVDRIIDALRRSGKSVSGNNPWNVNVNQHGITLNGSWDSARSNLRIKVTHKNGYVPYASIWKQIDPLIKNA